MQNGQFGQPRENDAVDETLEHMEEAARWPGGGGGNPGATMISRLEEPIRNMDAAQAADTGGVADNPLVTQEYLPAGELGLGGDYAERMNRAVPYGGLPGEYPPERAEEEA
ncbi:MAG TPA: hypothetical protein V6D47_20040 [Oscillatoriaceae cyanobacterium]